MAEAVTYNVPGIHCQHCKEKIETNVGRVAGVTEVSVDLSDFTVRVRGDDFSDGAVREAIAEAGYAAA